MSALIERPLRADLVQIRQTIMANSFFLCVHCGDTGQTGLTKPKQTTNEQKQKTENGYFNGKCVPVCSSFSLYVTVMNWLSVQGVPGLHLMSTGIDSSTLRTKNGWIFQLNKMILKTKKYDKPQ